MAFAPQNAFVTPLLTDKYQVTMAYAYYRTGTHLRHATFDLFFRKAPFRGEFTVFAGLEEALRFVAAFKFSPDEILAVRNELPTDADEGFFQWLANLDTSGVRVDAIDEGQVVFAKVPLMRIAGPLAVCQLLETTLLNLVNFASLVATNAARHRLAAGPSARVVEFGLRRAQGPDGAMSASRYSFLGGAHGTSNLAAARIFNIPATGTHAHAFVTSFSASDVLPHRQLPGAPADSDIVQLARQCRDELGFDRTNLSELLAFCAYALAFPDGFLALVDTYDTLESGVPNFLVVALALHRLGRRAVGIRLDSGDLAYFSKAARALFTRIGARAPDTAYFERFTIVASNDINEATLRSLGEQGHAIDVFGIGTNLVTCQAQPALGCVFKLVEVDAKARIKLSDDVGKANMPGRKVAHRLFGADQQPLVDLLQLETEAPLVPGVRLLCVHPFESQKRAYVTPSRIERLHHVYWLGSNATASDAELADAAAVSRVDASLLREGGTIGDDVFDNPERVRETPTSKPLPTTASGRITRWLPPLSHLRGRTLLNVKELRSDHVRQLNPTPYKVSVSQELHDFIKQLWLDEAPIHELK